MPLKSAPTGDTPSIMRRGEIQTAVDAGYPYGLGDNLTVFTGTVDAAQHAVNNWINSRTL